jgi:hypothetical protein
MLLGYNFPSHLSPDTSIEKFKKVGFYTTRWVRALTAKRAELKAVELVWKDPMLDGLEYPENLDERDFIRLEEIQKVDKVPKFRGGGATWFVEDEE